MLSRVFSRAAAGLTTPRHAMRLISAAAIRWNAPPPVSFFSLRRGGSGSSPEPVASLASRLHNFLSGVPVDGPRWVPAATRPVAEVLSFSFPAPVVVGFDAALARLPRPLVVAPHLFQDFAKARLLLGSRPLNAFFMLLLLRLGAFLLALS
jgi:hypothetical protein